MEDNYSLGRRLGGWIATCVCVAAHTGRLSAAQFIPLAFPTSYDSGIDYVANVLDVAADGSRVGGAISANGVVYDCISRCTTPFVWSRGGTVQIAPYDQEVVLEQNEFGGIKTYTEEIVALTHDRALGNGLLDPLIFGPNGIIALGGWKPGRRYVAASDLSDDGKTAVGSIYEMGAFRWTEAAGSALLETGLPPVETTGLSGDGKVVVGVTAYSPGTTPQAFRWSESHGTQVLDPLETEQLAYPNAATYDGGTIVGAAWTTTGTQAVRWTEQGPSPLGAVAGFADNAAVDVSADGAVIVGTSAAPTNFGLSGLFGSGTLDVLSASPLDVAARYRATIWNAGESPRLLQEWLATEHGLGDRLAGWTLASVAGISADGRVIAGVGVNPANKLEGWVVVIPEPATTSLIACGVGFFARCAVGRRPRRRWPQKGSRVVSFRAGK